MSEGRRGIKGSLRASSAKELTVESHGRIEKVCIPRGTKGKCLRFLSPLTKLIIKSL